MKRSEYIYYRIMKKATEDGFISLDETSLILILEDRLGLSDDQMDDVMGLIEEEKAPDLSTGEMQHLDADRSNHLYELEVYERVLKEALQDESIEEEEFSLLEELRKIIGVDEAERTQVFERIKDHFRDEEKHKTHPRLRDRLSHIFNLED